MSLIFKNLSDLVLYERGIIALRRAKAPLCDFGWVHFVYRYRLLGAKEPILSSGLLICCIGWHVAFIEIDHWVCPMRSFKSDRPSADDLD